MPTVVVFSPSLHGHRQTYCRVLAQILLDDGLDVVVVAGADAVPSVTSRLTSQLEELEGREGFSFVGLPESGVARLQRSPRGFIRLLDNLGAAAVVLTEADVMRRVLTRGSARLGGPRRWVGVFIRSTNYVHEVSRPTGGPLRVAAHGSRKAAHRMRHWGTDARLFHEALLPGAKLLDAALYLDETFVASHPRGALWLPDIFSSRPWSAATDGDETRRWELELRRFMASQGRRPVFVYVGTPQSRRGYDTLLRLAVAEEGCFVHCGRNEATDPRDEPGAKRALRDRGGVFETGSSYEDDATADLFLRQAAAVVLPYDHHLGSSGVMLQALAAGRPVLVPDEGLMARRVQGFGLGRTYRPGDWDDLRRNCRALFLEGRARYGPGIDAFIAGFSRSQTEAAVRHAMGYGAGPASPPTSVRGAAGGEAS